MLFKTLRLPLPPLVRLLIAAGVCAAAGAAAGAAGAAEAVRPAYFPADCPYQIQPADIACGHARLPENRGDSSGQVSLFIVQLGPGDSRRPPAVVLGGGGPGSGLFLEREDGIVFWDSYRRDILGDDGRLILADQRGAGAARPLLSCPEEEAVFLSLLRQPLPLAQEARQWRRALRQCHRRLTDSGAQVEAYTTAASADDFEDLRRLLDIPQWHLIGFSYGARLAMEIIRRHPRGVASALLDSPFPYDAARLEPAYPFAAAARRISEDCRRRESCRRHGSVAANLQRALAQPLPPVPVRYDGDVYTVQLSRERLLEIIHIALYDRTGAAVLPFLSRQLAQGDSNTDNSRYVVYNYLDFFLGEQRASMLNWHINCRENTPPPVPPPPPDTLESYEHRYFEEYLNTCRMLWPAPVRPPDIVRADKPLLIINGVYDVATPPAWGAALADRQPDARRLVVHDAHVPSLHTPCLKESIRAFFQAPGATITNVCEETPLTFY